MTAMILRCPIHDQWYETATRARCQMCEAGLPQDLPPAKARPVVMRTLPGSWPFPVFKPDT